MSGMKKIWETAIILIGTLGWWGFVYPELCLTEEVYEEEAPQQEAQTEDLWRDGILVDDLRIKSRFLEYVYQVKEKEAAEKELRYEQ